MQFFSSRFSDGEFSKHRLQQTLYFRGVFDIGTTSALPLVITQLHFQDDPGETMHAGIFIEMATDLSFNSRSVPFQTPIEVINSEEFWQISRDKLDHWTKTLNMFSEDLSNPSRNHNPWAAISYVIEEILCSEFFVRIAAATCVNKDREFDINVNAPIGRAVLLFHLEARVRALEIINEGLKTDIPEAIQLNELRNRLERWCDLLLAFFPNNVSSEFSFEPKRCQEFNQDFSEETETSMRNVEKMLRISVREYGRKLTQRPAANPTLNRKTAELFSFIELFTQSELETHAPFQTNQVSDLTNDAERWIEDYMTIA